jgi:hypothetical protein
MIKFTFSRAFLLIFAGPLVWAVHFFVIYGFTGVACARGLARADWLGVNVLSWVIGGSTVIAVLAILLIIRRTGSKGAMPDDFARWLTATLGVVSIIAMVWESMSVFLVPACALS